jgi:hypothetical protein
MDTVRYDDGEPERDVYTDEPVFDLGDMSEDTDGDETVAPASGLRSAALEQLATLFTPAALSLAGVIVAVLAALGPLFGTTALLNYGFVERATSGWAVWPVAVSGAVAVALGLAAWRLALATRAEVPRTAGASVLLGALLLVAALVLWTRPEPGNQPVGGAAANSSSKMFTSLEAPHEVLVASLQNFAGTPPGWRDAVGLGGR